MSGARAWREMRTSNGRLRSVLHMSYRRSALADTNSTIKMAVALQVDAIAYVTSRRLELRVWVRIHRREFEIGDSGGSGIEV